MNNRQGKPRIVDGKVDMKSYCCQEIDIPPILPGILKQYTKGALRTQPKDLLLWSAGYFRALTNGEVLPVKDRIENPIVQGKNGLSAGLLRILHHQFRKKKFVTVAEMREKWRGLCLKDEELDPLLKIAKTGLHLSWPTMLAVCAGSVGQNLSDTMRVICLVMTDQPEGHEPYIQFEHWWDIYTYLADLATVPKQVQQKVYDYLFPICTENFGAIGPVDFLRQECPPLLVEQP